MSQTTERERPSIDLKGLEAELSRRAQSKRDYVLDVRKVTSVVNQEDIEGGGHKSTFALEFQNPGGVGPDGPIDPFNERLPLTKLAFEQMLDWAGVPRAYGRRMLYHHPDLLAINMNEWLHDPKLTKASTLNAKGKSRHGGEKRLVRCLDGEIRAWLSNRYRPLDNHDLLFSVLDTFNKSGVEIWDARVTDTHFYLKGLHRDIVEKIAPGGISQKNRHEFIGPHVDDDGTIELLPTVTIKNSEVGASLLRVDLGVFTTGCYNWSIISQAIKQAHVGRVRDVGEILSDNTRKLEDQVVFAKVADHVRAAFNEETFKKLVEKVRGTTEKTVEEPTKAVDHIAKDLTLTDERKTALLNLFARNSDPTVFGLSSAMTEAAQKIEDPDERDGWERYGGAMLVGNVAVKGLA